MEHKTPKRRKEGFLEEDKKDSSQEEYSSQEDSSQEKDSSRKGDSSQEDNELNCVVRGRHL